MEDSVYFDSQYCSHDTLCCGGPAGSSHCCIREGRIVYCRTATLIIDSQSVKVRRCGHAGYTLLTINFPFCLCRPDAVHYCCSHAQVRDLLGVSRQCKYTRKTASSSLFVRNQFTLISLYPVFIQSVSY